MARQTLDTTQNELPSTMIGKLNTMLTELYDSFAGATDPSVTTVTASGLATVGSLKVDTGTKTATATAGAATLNKQCGVITSESLTTAAGAVYTLTITNSTVGATDICWAAVYNGTNTAGTPCVTTVTPGSGSLAIEVKNIHGTNAFNGTLKIAFITMTL